MEDSLKFMKHLCFVNGINSQLWSPGAYHQNSYLHSPEQNPFHVKDTLTQSSNLNQHNFLNSYIQKNETTELTPFSTFPKIPAPRGLLLDINWPLFPAALVHFRYLRQGSSSAHMSIWCGFLPKYPNGRKPGVPEWKDWYKSKRTTKFLSFFPCNYEISGIAIIWHSPKVVALYALTDAPGHHSRVTKFSTDYPRISKDGSIFILPYMKLNLFLANIHFPLWVLYFISRAGQSWLSTISCIRLGIACTRFPWWQFPLAHIHLCILFFFLAFVKFLPSSGYERLFL